MKIRKFESFNSDISKLSELSVDDDIIYNGSKYTVTATDETIITAKSKKTGREIKINQGQLDNYGIKIIS